MIQKRKAFAVTGVFTVAILAAACGRTTQTSEPLQNSDAGAEADSGLEVLDGAPAPQWDGAVSVDGDSAAASDSAGISDGRTDALNEADLGDAPSEPDTSDQGDGPDSATTPDATDSSAPIDCSETATCDTPIQLPTIWGGVVAGINEETQLHGDHSDWYYVEVTQYQGNVATTPNVDVAVFVTPPAGMEFDLDVYVTSSIGYPGACSQPVSGSATGSASAQSVHVSFPNTGLAVLGWVTVHVKAKPGTECATGAPWWLEVSTGG